MNKQKINDKLKKLRELWLKEPQNRRIIEIRAQCLKLALEKAKVNKTLTDVRETLL